MISNRGQVDLGGGPASPLFYLLGFLKFSYIFVSKQSPSFGTPFNCALVSKLITNFLATIFQNLLAHLTLTLLAISFQAFSFARKSLYDFELTCQRQGKQRTASLVYPDPYKKGLGNKARSSVHIGM